MFKKKKKMMMITASTIGMICLKAYLQGMVEAEAEAKGVMRLMMERQRLRRQGMEGKNWCYIVSQVQGTKRQKGSMLATFYYY
jgi:hypothetical protein